MATKNKQPAGLTAKQPKQISSQNSDLSSSNQDGDRKLVKRIPPIKAPVGLAKGPDLKNCKSKIGSLNNIKHTPAGGRITIPSQKLKWEAKSKVGSLENKEHKPGGGAVKVESRKLEWKTSSKVQSLQNIDHKAGGGNVKIFNDSYADDIKKKSAKANETERSDSASSCALSSNMNSDSIAKDLKNMKLEG